MARPIKNAPDKSVIEKAISALNNLTPPPKKTIKDVLEAHKSEIMAALDRGNKVPQIAKCLSDNGLKTSRETLRQLVETWTRKPTKKVETTPRKKRIHAPNAETREQETAPAVEQKQNFDDKQSAYDNDEI